jgi:hypothetical protein
MQFALIFGGVEIDTPTAVETGAEDAGETGLSDHGDAEDASLKQNVHTGRTWAGQIVPRDIVRISEMRDLPVRLTVRTMTWRRCGNSTLLK